MRHSANITRYVEQYLSKMHPFKLWLTFNKKRLIDVAPKLGVTPTYLCGMFRYDRYPSMELAMKIEDFTNGEIKAIDIVKQSNH